MQQIEDERCQTYDKEKRCLTRIFMSTEMNRIYKPCRLAVCRWLSREQRLSCVQAHEDAVADSHALRPELWSLGAQSNLVSTSCISCTNWVIGQLEYRET